MICSLLLPSLPLTPECKQTRKANVVTSQWKLSGPSHLAALAAVGTEQIIHQALNYSSRVTLAALLLRQVQDRIGHNEIHEKSLAIETTFFPLLLFQQALKIIKQLDEKYLRVWRAKVFARSIKLSKFCSLRAHKPGRY